MSCWALVPVKARKDCKTRLAKALAPDQRLALVRAVLRHVLDILGKVERIDHIALVSPERDTVPGFIEVLPERGHDLNSSLTRAMTEARSRGATRVLILHSDLPDIRGDDVEALLDGADEHGLAIAPDDRGTGTNGLCLPADLSLPLQFGKGSFHSHVESARRAGYNPAIVRTGGLGFDLDNSADLDYYQTQSSTPPSRPNTKTE